MAAYMDYSGWMHKQFLGQGEFTLDFGDYTLSITVPSDHIVAATGEWAERLERAHRHATEAPRSGPHQR